MTSIPPLLDPADVRPYAAAALGDWLDLQRALALHPERAAPLLRRTGCPRAALRAWGQTPRPSAEERAGWIASLRRIGAVGLPLLSPAYPVALSHLADPAPLLWVRGQIEALAGPCVAVVGARAATAYGRQVAAQLAFALARAGVVVVSGLAAGIDAAAHRAALDAGGRTVAVQACGPDRVYPAVHRELAARIERSGALVSEFAPGTPPRRHHFPLRNRLISGLSSMVVVVEARLRSGSLVTARLAGDQGRDVFAVPGPITSPTSAGPHRLLSQGAGVADGPDAVLEELRAMRRIPAAVPEAAPTPAREAGTRRRILLALRDEPGTRDELANRLGCSPQDLSLDLLELEMEGRIAEDRDGRLCAIA